MQKVTFTIMDEMNCHEEYIEVEADFTVKDKRVFLEMHACSGRVSGVEVDEEDAGWPIKFLAAQYLDIDDLEEIIKEKKAKKETAADS